MINEFRAADYRPSGARGIQFSRVIAHFPIDRLLFLCWQRRKIEEEEEEENKKWRHNDALMTSVGGG